jgi:hypothetical protein
MYCINESVYSEHITKRKEYMIEEINVDKQQVRIKNNQQKLVWIPIVCFDANRPPDIIAITIDDEINNSMLACIEVTVELSTREMFWTTFITPDYINLLLDSNTSLTLTNFIIVKEVNKDIIDNAILDLDKKNKLLNILIPY